MSIEQQWISTSSMNRFYDHCYLIECAYHIISRYCCSFTNLLAHDDGSIPYYLVQKVKIAVEYGRILLNTRYRPFQHQLRVHGSYDYIDQSQYESLCTMWNTIKAETQIVEMYFNQISLLIYPVVSSSSLPFLESVDHEDVSALIKINAIIHGLISDDNESSSSSSPKDVTDCLLQSSDYFDEEELGMFIVNSIIEPLFEDEDDEPQKGDPRFKCCGSGTSLQKSRTYCHDRTASSFVDSLRCMSPAEISNFPNQLTEGGGIFGDDMRDVFRAKDELLLNGIFTNVPRAAPFVADSQSKMLMRDDKSETKKYSRGDGGCRWGAVRYDNQKRVTIQRRQSRSGYDKKFSHGNYEFVNRKFTEYSTNGKNCI